ncbi:G protein-activated inward rectifier potassium channel 3-like isoform X1 [Onthophagus taurus]|uniref:G protein-activated inward rectifier potassium channel 3-like isoform X1 n=1 Tax=Onthophagus taurus TaxID=166361 RepID=UPI0039BE2B6B
MVGVQQVGGDSVVVQCQEIDDHKQFSVRTTLPQTDNDDYIGSIRKYNQQGPHIIEGFNSDGRKSPVGRRLIKKTGKYNVLRKTESSLTEKYLRDFFNTLVSGKWWKIILAASSVFILCWLTFGVVWMLISTSNGDLEANPINPCITGVQSFAGYFLFSLESQVSIGYGTRSITDHCLEGAFVLCIQLIIGIFVCGVTINVVYMKIVKPSSRFRHNVFSKHAIVCRRDGHLCLIFRVHDEECRHAISTSITAYILKKDGETGEPYLEVLNLEPYGFLIWPLEVVHRITSKSPLWDISSYNLISDKFEIIVTIQGSSATTGQCSKTRTSYISSEILWGYKFKNCIKYNKPEAMYDIQRKNFNKTVENATHLCSAKKFYEVYRSMTPTPSVSRNYNLKINVTYDGTKRRGTIMSIESENSKENNKEEKSKDCEDPDVKENEEIFDDLNYFHETPIISNMDDSWMMESKSMPAITNFSDYPNSSNFSGVSKNHNSYMDHFSARKFNNIKSGNRIFEDDSVYEIPHQSLMSNDYPKSEFEFEQAIDLDTMLTSMEEYLDRNSCCSVNSNLSVFPKT